MGNFDSSSHPSLPDPIYGYRFWGDSGGTVDTLTFRTDFPPMWGDFFSSGLNDEDYASNDGFLSPDIDPVYCESNIGNGSFAGHILVPGGGPIIPEPGCPTLLMGIFLFGRYRRPLAIQELQWPKANYLQDAAVLASGSLVSWQIIIFKH